MLAENFSGVLEVFKTKAPTLIGVDVASTSIKLVELAEAGKGAYRLERYAIEPLGKDTVQDGNIANLDQVSDALKRAWKRLGSRNRNVAMALPAAMVITKKIIVPSGQKEEELELTVEAEVVGVDARMAWVPDPRLRLSAGPSVAWAPNATGPGSDQSLGASFGVGMSPFDRYGRGVSLELRGTRFFSSLGEVDWVLGTALSYRF